MSSCWWLNHVKVEFMRVATVDVAAIAASADAFAHDGNSESSG